MRTKTRDDRERAVVEYWHRGGLSPLTVQLYLGWIRRFRKYWRDLQGATRPLLHDGRQPRQLAGLAFLGVRARPQHRRQGVLRMDEFQQLEAHRRDPLRTSSGASTGAFEHEV